MRNVSQAAVIDVEADNLLVFPTREPKTQTAEKPAPQKQVWTKPEQGDVVVVLDYLEDVRIYGGQYVVGRPWSEDSPTVNLNGWLVRWSELHAHIEGGRANVIYKPKRG